MKKSMGLAKLLLVLLVLSGSALAQIQEVRIDVSGMF